MEHVVRRTKKVWTICTTASPLGLYRLGRITLRELLRLYIGADANAIPRNLPRRICQDIEKLRKDKERQEAVMTRSPDKNRDQNGARTAQVATTPDRLSPYDLRDELIGWKPHPQVEPPYCGQSRIPRSGVSPVDVAERMDGWFEDT